MSFPRYPSYKDSGVEWLSHVPSHWEIAKIRRLANLGMGQTILREMLEDGPCDGALPVYSASEGDEPFGYFRNPSVRLEKGDLIVGARGSIGMSRAVVCESTCTQTTIWVKFAREQLHPGFAYWTFVGGREGLFPFDKTAIPMLTVEQVASGKMPLPQVNEQIAIAAFLDRETAKIDALVAEQENLIGLLKEKRQAVISHAVTKGLDPSVPMKDSGVAWLGEVPAHWEVTPIKYLVELRSGGTPSKDNMAYWNGDVPWASAKDLKVERLAATADCITEHAVDSGAASLVPAGAVLIVVRGMILARIFPVVLTMTQMAINQDLKAVIPLGSLDNGFLAWLLRGTSAESLLRLDEAGHGTKALRMDAWTSMQLPVPPSNEQTAIATFLDHETAKIDELVAEAQSTITLLQERRTALISAAVTGQIDVRQAMPNV